MSRGPAGGFAVVIPARYDSTRLPGKPLRELNGKALVHHVYDVGSASGASDVIVATDDVRIEAYCKAHGLAVAMTSRDHASGTDRCAEVAARLGWAAERVVVNLQGDEPLVPPDYLARAAQHVSDDCLATLAAPMTAPADVQDPNRVKVVCAADGRALYFSRAPIPWQRDADTPRALDPLHHIGIYAYRVDMLSRLTELEPCALEQTEALEQLRALYHGFGIRVASVAALPGPGVDTPEDLERVAQRLAEGPA